MDIGTIKADVTIRTGLACRHALPPLKSSHRDQVDYSAMRQVKHIPGT